MLIQKLTLRGLLSFGPDSPPLELRNLNVLIGPNGSGKSNFIEAIDLLRSSATNLGAPMQSVGGGGVTEWMWKGAPRGEQNAEIEAIITSQVGPPRCCTALNSEKLGAVGSSSSRN